ncbi:MAG: hypothetical protein UR25_C0004G0103 [Candidatus Nomurabacteria bacterium GW2011_GWE1_32_28]|uniref:Uncharacterized protein n=1 Tax=Candidatus Nomurabacteria bacterium GW2011_GWF1_31_48 TaxID=1618767 RepID=A0A0F9YFQ8_9BACT|nr:MAG: hypothetical protein UR10_C0004G0103 [Candidatus Nomurabacteria bacterium GW2011_GWF2_30_133]KKP28637.1 MAG: hypothetical protein UR18_C0002G0049 [Candidatus Nomurabacteria bacterium GW2011_GWE2_31_40]KKP30213.1 MAG: hypothetical protein UR19_C0003G0049 [Candidatus Nomurabacteria bacterium GW2011_GWF1_31_48]KKP34739.1 MAG: hypothetical protein UR25_C0004G0103 [Candidatus Nomurabacteria bacterium GW2011_GWE1_32_28]HAS80803.1 hypothetical protein [Candidatus Nomurabacteria bacterium]
MNTEYKFYCKKCNNLTHQIGFYGFLKKEGDSVSKGNLVSFDCTNRRCEHFGKIIKVKLSELISSIDK